MNLLKAAEHTPSMDITKESYVMQRNRCSAYLSEHWFGVDADPLLMLLAQHPVMTNYKESCEDLSKGLVLDNIRYISHQHVMLLILLHKLGIRGVGRGDS